MRRLVSKLELTILSARADKKAISTKTLIKSVAFGVILPAMQLDQLQNFNLNSRWLWDSK